MRRALLLLAALLAIQPASAQMLLSGAGPASPPLDPILTLVSAMPHGSWKKITDVNCGKFYAQEPTHNRLNYDAGTTWANDAAVAASLGANDSSGTSCDILGQFAFSKPIIALTDKLIVQFGGGHNDSGIGDVAKLDLVVAATSINNTGTGGDWALGAQGTRYLDAFTQNRPVGSLQNLDSPASGCTTAPCGSGADQLFWQTTNLAGDPAPVACHSYSYGMAMAAHKYALGCRFTFPNANGGYPGSIFLWDSSTGHISLSFQDATNTKDGLAGPAAPSQQPPPVVYDPDHDTVWVYNENNFSQAQLRKWTSPGTNAPTLSGVIIQDNALQPSLFETVYMPDPINGAGHFAIWEHNSQSNTVYGFSMFTDILGTPSSCHANYTSTFGVLTTAVEQPGWTYDSTRNLIVFSIGDTHLYKITPTSSGVCSGWAEAELTSSPTGDIPAMTGRFVRLQYWPAYDIYVLAASDIYFYRP